MQIDASKSSISTGKASINNNQLASSVREGQILNGRVTAVSSSGATQNNYIVNINKQLVELSSSLKFQQGQALILRVQQAQPKLLLEVLDSTTGTQASTRPAASTLKELIPQQQGLQYLTAALLQTAQGKSLPKDLDTALQQLRQVLPGTADMQNPSRLAQLIRNSGLFMESTIAAGRNLPAGDFKLLWMTLLSAASRHLQSTGITTRAALSFEQVTPLPFAHGIGMQPRVSARSTQTPDKSLDQILLKLFGIADSAVSRISLSQVVTAEAQQSGDMRWKMDIPLMLPNQEIGIAEFLIEREKDGDTKQEDDDQSRNWVVHFTLDIPGLGPLMVRLALQGDKLDTRIHAEEETTTRLISEHMDRLQAKLSAQGLDISRISCQQGIPRAVKSSSLDGMIDLKA